MGDIFDVETNTITYHIGEIYKSGELDMGSTTRKIRVVQNKKKDDFNKIAKQIKETGKLPTTESSNIEPLSDFNKNLITAIKNNPK